MQIMKLGKDTQFPYSDFIFEKYKDYIKVVPYLIPKIQGTWTVTLVDFTMEQMKEVEASNLPSFVEIIAYMKADLMEVFLQEFPKYTVNTKSSWDQMIEVIISKKLDATGKALKMLYNRCKGNADEIFRKLNDIEKIIPEGGMITEKEVDALVKEEDVIYSRDIILSLLLKGDKGIPSRGNYLSKFKNADTIKLVDRFVSELGRNYAFYALRKYIKKLYDNKMKFIQNKDCKDEQVLKRIDVFTLAHALVCFEMSNPKQLYVVLDEIERRNKNDSDFRRTFLYCES